MSWKLRMLTAIVGIAALLASCSSGSSGGEASQVGKPASISHIHGLGIDEAGTLYVATHYGLIKQSANRWVYAGADKDDHMGFSLHPGDGVMYRSGHSPSRPSLGVESSTDDGAGWTHLSDVENPPVDFHAMAVSFADSKTLWGWDSGGRGTFRSTDGGKTWTRLDARGVERQIYVLSGPAQANEVLAGTMSGLYRSTDGGSTWNPVAGTTGGWVIGIGADPKDPKHLLVSTQRGVKMSRDGGTTWSDAGSGLPAEVTQLAISPTDGDLAYAADSSSIYKTTDGGKSWTRVS